MGEDFATLLERSERLEVARNIESIEIAAWLIAGLLLFGYLLTYIRYRKGRSKAAGEESQWQTFVESAYEKGSYDDALEALETAEMLFPKSAVVRLWQGRCYFQQQAWDKAAAKFQECVRLEPWYRKSIRDWMAFIELNNLVPGIEGYLEKE